ncbi:primase-helicase family protein [Tardiphaga sp. 20_F10_N6_6]|uniref:primase-helicase family protein n=1 Tax=Tardiphaga sp. 20_F10_N6_6 TaxID=3240788 RepID=UPI003F88E365
MEKDTAHRPAYTYDQLANLIVGEIDPPEGSDVPSEIEEINQKHALTMWGSKAVVVIDDPEAPIQIRSLEAHKAWYANRRMQIVDASGNSRSAPLGTAWLNHPLRRQYEGVEFWPNPDGAPGRAHHFNLWRGFSVTPSEEGRYGVFKDHILNNICQGDQSLYAYVFGWFAQIIQKPREKSGTALVLRGQMGTGKSKLGEVFGSLIGEHYVQIDEGRYVTGQFNGHMANCLLLQADEAVWAGDKSAEGRLKGLITSEHQMIEAKGVDPLRMANYVRCVMTSNEGWVVPAGMDERRFCVLDVHPRCAQNGAYFGEMHEELKAGGRQRLLFDLQRFDLNSVNLRKIPRTKALLDQKLRSLDSVDSYWFGRLWEGMTTSESGEWLTEVSTAVLFQDYVKVSSQIGERRRQNNSQFGERLQKLGARRRRPADKPEEGKSIRPYRYCFASLAQARADFEKLLGQQVDWPETAANNDEVPF